MAAPPDYQTTGQPQQTQQPPQVVYQQQPPQQQVVYMQQQQQPVQQTGQPQVVYVQQPAQQQVVYQQQPVQTTVQMPSEGAGTGGQAPAVQTTVVVNQTVPAGFPPRKWRFPYGYFAVAVGIWQGLCSILWGILSTAEGEWGALFMFSGFIPSIGTIVWLWMDASVTCCGQGWAAQGKVAICGFPCANPKWLMSIPMGIFSFLRSIMYFVAFGHLADWLYDIDEDSHVDHVFWIILFLACWDLGPLICIACDFWYQYGKEQAIFGSGNGVLGTHANPLRCIVAQCSLMMVASWSLIAVVAEYDAVADIWAWVIHAIMSTAALVVAAIFNYSGVVKGNTVATSCHRIIWQIFGVVGSLLLPVVLIWSIVEAGSGGIWFYFFFYYYTALTVPSVVAFWSFKVNDPAMNAAVQSASVGQAEMQTVGVR